MHKRFLLTAAASALLATSATAADMPMSDYAPPPAAAPMVMVHDWTGVYAGATAGYAWGRYKLSDPDTGESFGFSGDGVVLGGTLGANWQVDSWVFGLEGDLSWANIDGRRHLTGDERVSSKSDWFATLRGRVGYAVEQVLIYGTGGLAFTKDTVRVADGSDFYKGSKTHTGWTLGGGIEVALTDNLSAKTEYLYADFGSKNHRLADEVVRVGHKTHIVRAGLNYRFSW